MEPYFPFAHQPQRRQTHHHFTPGVFDWVRSIRLSALLESIRRSRLGRVIRAGDRAPRFELSKGRIEQLVGRSVLDIALYERALTHRSILRAHPESKRVSNERLEFLGDAVLGFIVAEHLHHRFPSKDEGFLTKLRSKLVNGQALARCARSVALGPLVIMSDNMEQTGGRASVSILADAYEAVIGAVYLDLGLQEARAFIHRTMFADIDLEALAAQHDNYKSLLLEYAQARSWPQPRYRVLTEEGPSHDRTFTVQVLINDQTYGTGTAGSKKRAEQLAAGEALSRIERESNGA